MIRTNYSNLLSQPTQVILHRIKCLRTKQHQPLNINCQELHPFLGFKESLKKPIHWTQPKRPSLTKCPIQVLSCSNILIIKSTNKPKKITWKFKICNRKLRKEPKNYNKSLEMPWNWLLWPKIIWPMTLSLLSREDKGRKSANPLLLSTL